MNSASPAPGIVLVDDGELDEVVRVLEAGGLAFTRLRGGQIPERVPTPDDVLIVTSRRLEHVASPPATGPERDKPLRIVAVSDDSPALRRRLRRQRIHLLVRLPASRETWRLLIARALYQGEDRREDARVATEVPIEVAQRGAVLVDLSNRGCRIESSAELAVGDVVRFAIPGRSLPDRAPSPLSLSGRVRRIARLADSDRRIYAVVFDAELPRTTRRRLTDVINHWGSGDAEGGHAVHVDGPAIPACRLPSLPDLMLDDETDPPVRANGEIAIELRPATPAMPADPPEAAAKPPGERRSGPRGAYPSLLRAANADHSLALVGRDLSARGMRIERHPGLMLGDRFRLALHGPTLAHPLTLDATVVRDDADEGMALAFIGVSKQTAVVLEKLVACLPDVESLADGELGGLGTVLSEIVRD